MGRKCFTLVAAVAATASLFVGSGSSAYGALTFSVSGQITSNAFWDGVPIPSGTPVSVSGSLDPNTPDGSSDTSFGAYDDPAGAISLSVGGHTIDLTGCTAYVQDNYVPGYGAADMVQFTGYAFALDGLRYSIQAGFWCPPAMFDGDSLANALLLNDGRPWTIAHIYLFAYTETGNSAGRYFTTTAVDGATVSVPEPVTAAWAGLAVLGACASRRHRVRGYDCLRRTPTARSRVKRNPENLRPLARHRARRFALRHGKKSAGASGPSENHP